MGGGLQRARAAALVTRPLTERQRTALLLAAHGFVSAHTSASMPSLARRGLVERYYYTEAGRRYSRWRITEAGCAEAKRIEEG